MKTKKFKHNKIEIGKLSKKEIDTDSEKYSVFLDCDGEEILSIGFYKTEMLRDLIKGKGKLVEQSFMERQKDMAGKVMTNLSKIMGVPEQNKVYEVESAN